MPLSQFVAIFLLEEVAFLLYALLILRSSQFCFEFKKKCDQVQKLVRPWTWIILLSVADEVIPIRMSLYPKGKCVLLNAAVAICQRYRPPY